MPQRYEYVYIDIPTRETIGDDDGPWTNVHTVHTKEEAVAWIRENIGPCDDEGNVCLITLGEPRDTEDTDDDQAENEGAAGAGAASAEATP